MALQMVHRNERNASRLSHRLAGHQPHQHPADQPRPGSRRHAVELSIRNPRRIHRRRHRRVRQLCMCPRRNLRHHAQIRRMLLQLRSDNVGEQRHFPVLKPQDSSSGLVAGGFDAKDSDGAGHAGPRP